jgi:hypothetical protein
MTGHVAVSGVGPGLGRAFLAAAAGAGDGTVAIQCHWNGSKGRSGRDADLDASERLDCGGPELRNGVDMEVVSVGADGPAPQATAGNQQAANEGPVSTAHFAPCGRLTENGKPTLANICRNSTSCIE